MLSQGGVRVKRDKYQDNDKQLEPPRPQVPKNDLGVNSMTYWVR